MKARLSVMQAVRVIALATIIGTLTLPAFAQPNDPVSTLQDHKIEVYLAENALQGLYTTEFDAGDLGMNEIGAGFLFSEGRDFFLTGDMLVNVGQRPEHPRWMLDVGPRVYSALLNVEKQDIFTIAVGGRLSYLVRQNGATTISVSAFFAPDIITFGITDNVVDISIQFETQLTPLTRTFLGYRSFEFALRDAKLKIDDDIYIGFRHRF